MQVASVDDQKAKLQRIRAGFVLQGTSLARWCRENGVKRQHLEESVLGRRKGPRSMEIVEKAVDASTMGRAK